jgi:hypothetical protein
VERLRNKVESASGREWKTDIVRAILYLRISSDYVSREEWQVWLGDWKNFGARLTLLYPKLACYIAFAVGTARDDEDLFTLAFTSLAHQIKSRDELANVIRDIRRVVAFMKAAISVYRTEPLTKRLFSSIPNSN